MPASEPPPERPGRRLLTAVFWSGVGLAPLAALLLLVGQGAGALRVAAVLAVLAVVLIGLSITLRRDAETVRLDMEETLLEEVDMLREDVRNDIATAARATHKAFGEKLQALQETVQALRVQIEMNAGGPPGMPQRQEAPAAVGAGHPAMPQPPGAGQVGGRARVPGGVVRHTETVQVTTRQTIVDPHGDDSGNGTVYGGNTYGGGYEGSGYGDAWAPPSAPRGRRAAEPGEESWSDQRLRTGGDGRRPRPYDRGDGGPGDGGPGDRGLGERGLGERGLGERGPGDDGRWTGMRAGDRWASVRSDERGREVRMGERRAAMHSDESGSEMRIEDRWAAVRRDEPRRDDYRAEAAWRSGADPGGAGGSWQQGERWERRGPAGALPAGGIEPTTSWGQQWGAPEREPAGRRRRYRDEDDGYR